jgi:hypothetical protein
MRRWLPHIHVGGVCTECVRDEEGGREGRYIGVCWLGFMVEINFVSVYADRRDMARYRAEREAS